MKMTKKILSILLSLMLVLGTVAVRGMTASADGYVYEISSYSDLMAFASLVNSGETGLNAKLMYDIDASGYTDWTPIGNNNKQYTGTFDGLGHKITGLTYNNPQQDNVGLFGFVNEGGKVRNVGLEGGKINGTYNVGGVAGRNSGTVTNCYNTGDVSGTENVGGVVGLNYGTVTDCYNTESVSGTGNNVGGVVGLNYGTVTDCYNTGSVSSTGNNVGGVAGFISNNAEVKNCYNTGDVSGSRYVGGVAGFNSSQGKATNCYYDSDICTGVNAIGYGSGTNVTGLTTDLMTGESALENMVFTYEAGEESPWLTRANNQTCFFYPHLKGFAYDSEPLPANWPPKIVNVIEYPLWVGGNQVTSDNMDSLDALDGIAVTDGGSVKFVPDDDGKGGTLYLNNATITGTKEYDFGGDFTSNILVENTEFDLTINVEGENIINGSAGEGIFLPNDNDSAALTIEGEGSIDITAVLSAILCYGSLSVDGTTVNATATEDEYGGDGIKSNYINITGSAVKAEASSPYGGGLYAYGSLNIADSTVEATGRFTGIYVDNSLVNEGLTVSGISIVTAEGGNELSGIFSRGGYHFEDGNDIVTPENFKYGTFGVGTIILNSDDSPATTVVIGQPCTVTFNNYDGTELQSGKILKGTAPEYKGETPTRTDESGQYTYTFSGWKDGNNNEYAPGAAFPAAEGDITYTAQFTETPVDYTVTFFVDGKQYSQSTVPFGAPVSSPRTPQKDNYDFTGWDAEIPDTMPAQNLEFNAVFKAIEYTATFTADGETVKEVKFTVEDDSIDEPAVPDKEGYEGKWSAYTLAAADVTIKAEYTAIEYTATFVDENGETVEEVPYTVETESIEEPDVPEKQGYAGEWEEYELTIGGITVKPVYANISSIEIEDYTDSSESGYREDRTFTVNAENLPEGAEIHWFVNGEDVGTGESYTVEDPTEDYNIYAAVVDADGNTLDETQVQAVKVRNGFMDKLKWFFSDFWNNIFKAVIDAIIKAC